MSGDDIRFRPIGRIYTDFPTKFGLPRQSAPGSALTGRVVFEPEYRVREAFRGLESVTHIWLLWLFSAPPHGDWSPTVRPPRLGGNRRMGVFATRSPNRPNPIGLTCVKLEAVEPDTRDGPVLYVSGVDMQSGTPLLDVKPYLPYADARPDACVSRRTSAPARRSFWRRTRGRATTPTPRASTASPTRARICISRSPTAF